MADTTKHHGFGLSAAGTNEQKRTEKGTKLTQTLNEALVAKGLAEAGFSYEVSVNPDGSALITKGRSKYDDMYGRYTYKDGVFNFVRGRPSEALQAAIKEVLDAQSGGRRKRKAAQRKTRKQRKSRKQQKGKKQTRRH